MEPQTNFDLNNFTTDPSENFSLSETTAQSAVHNSETWTDAEIARLIQVVVRPILLIVGTAGNGLTFYIMRRTSLKNVSSCFYMSLLALADTSKWTFVFISFGKLYNQPSD